VSSTKQDSDSDIHVDTDLTGEVEIHFKSDYFPVERFANAGTIGQIQQNTPVPSANPLGDTPATGGTVGAYESPRTRPRPSNTPALPPAGSALPPPPEPAQPAKPSIEVRHVDAPKDSIWYDKSAHKDDATPGAADPSAAPATPPAGDKAGGDDKPSGGEKPSADKEAAGDKKAAPSPDAPVTGKKGSGSNKPKGANQPDAVKDPASVTKSLNYRPQFGQGVFA
jgi:hypothetical protein